VRNPLLHCGLIDTTAEGVVDGLAGVFLHCTTLSSPPYSVKYDITDRLTQRKWAIGTIFGSHCCFCFRPSFSSRHCLVRSLDCGSSVFICGSRKVSLRSRSRSATLYPMSQDCCQTICSSRHPLSTLSFIKLFATSRVRR